MQALLLLIFALCLATSFLMSGMEAGVFALSRLRIRQQMRAGNPRAQVLHDYLEKPENFLWTILVGNTTANFFTASIGVIGLHYWLGQWPALFWMGFLVGGVLFYALFELFPKMLFRLYPNRLCLLMATPFRAVHFAVRPLVALSALLARKVLRGTGARPFTGNLFGNRDELRLVMQESAKGFTSEERAMINRVLDLQNLTVGQISVPMSKAVTVSMETPVKQLLALGRERGFTRLPVWKTEGTRRRIAGLVSLKSLLYRTDLDPSKTAGDYLSAAIYLDSETRLEVALQQMQRHGQRLAIVLGPDRSELGLVSLQDILKFIFGEVSL
jgi:CBS domain containing-hemolysin-like protein